MVNPRFLSRLLTDGLLLVLAGCLALPFELNAQVHPTPQQSGQGANPQPAAQAQLDKLEDARKAAHAAGDAKVEAKTLGQIGDLYFGVPDFQKAGEKQYPGTSRLFWLTPESTWRRIGSAWL